MVRLLICRLTTEYTDQHSLGIQHTNFPLIVPFLRNLFNAIRSAALELFSEGHGFVVIATASTLDNVFLGSVKGICSIFEFCICRYLR
jgi:hypothetical protein